MSKQAFKAFRIAHSFSLPGGRRYRKTGFHQAKSRSEEEVLTKAQFAHELASGTEAPKPLPSLAAAPSAPVTAPAPAHEEKKTDEPDWAFMTMSAMRAWLDRAGVMLPGQGGSKETHESLCKDAWTAGRRPHPLYGFAGGPEPSPGLAGPPGSQDPVVFAKAIEAAHAGGFTIPEATRHAFEALTTESVAETAAPARETQEGTREDASASVPATNSEDATEPPGSTSDAQEGSQEPEEDAPPLFSDLISELKEDDATETTIRTTKVLRDDDGKIVDVVEVEAEEDEGVVIHEGEELVVTVGDDGDLSLATQPDQGDEPE